ncbi:MAG: hypothetical protein ACFFBD_22550 [Candidatus Hodarchaeota archaeon]
MTTEKIVIFEISSKDVSFRLEGTTIPKDEESSYQNVLLDILPFGEAPEKTFIHQVRGDKHYFVYVEVNGHEGKGILLTVDKLPPHLEFLTDCRKLLQNFPDIPFTININEDQRPDPPNIHIRNIDAALFSILAGESVFVIDTPENVFEIIKLFYLILPESIREKFTFLSMSNSEQQKQNWKITGLENISEFQEDAVIIQNKIAYGPYQSDTCKQVARLLEKNQLEEAVNILQDLQTLVESKRELDLTKINVREFQIQHELAFNDAQLVIKMIQYLYKGGI